MHTGLYPKVACSCTMLLTFCVPFVVTTIQFVSTMSSLLTLPGGKIFPIMEWLQLSAVPAVGPIVRFHLMPLGCWVMESCFSVTGSQVHGSHHRSPSLLSTKNFSLLWWQPTSGVYCELPEGSTSYQITAQW